ncbi:MAG: FtsW/RodA/SpoVE family cell cycle protein [Lachnospiraceae bacterium]|nr:FtsW/RodA/SpoVE family cell cycle protein [Lachnospiraceae bacterium]
MFKKKGYSLSNYRFSIVSIIVGFLALSCILLFKLQSNDQSALIKQLLGVALGLFIMVSVSLVDYHFIAKMFIPLYLINLFFMFICKYVTYSQFPLIYGWNHFKARRWIKIGGHGEAGSGFEFMPSEITKIVLIIVMAKMFCMLGKRLNTVFGLLLTLVVIGFPIFLVFNQPDLSTSIVLAATFIIMLFIAGLSYRVLAPAILVGFPLFAGLLWYVQQDYQMLLEDWQQDRILSIFNPEQYSDLMYQQNNAAAAIASGGMFGKTIVDNSGRRLTDFVPVVESDFIFSAVAEEFGFIGCVIIVLMFLGFVFISFRIARRAKDRLGYLIASGIAVTIALQTIVNIGVVISLLPNTGIPLPFLSIGLSSLITNMATVGILLNVGLQDRDVVVDEKYEFEEGLLE